MRADLPIAASFWQDNNQWISAAITIVVAVAIAEVFDHAIAARARRMAAAVGRDELSPVATTRLRLIRRLLFALIVLIGVALALSQFDGVKRLAAGLLASSAVLGIVFGFAARQTLANAVAGVLLAITQPIRIGDRVTFEETTGVVEDVRLTYTYLRADDDRRLVIPNERLASSTIENHTIVDPRTRAEVSLWIDRDADVRRALDVLGAEAGVEASVAEVDREGVRLTAATWVATPAERDGAAADLRLRSLERLRAERLSSSGERQ